MESPSTLAILIEGLSLTELEDMRLRKMATIKSLEEDLNKHSGRGYSSVNFITAIEILWKDLCVISMAIKFINLAHLNGVEVDLH